MPNASRPARSSVFQLAQAGVEAVLQLFAYYLIPIVIGVVSVIALLFWHNQYRATGDVGLKMQVMLPDAALSKPVAALAALRARPPVDSFDTHLSEQPVWFSVASASRQGSD